MLCPVRTGWLILSLIVAAVASAGPTYRWVDADGVHYSDQPHPGAEQITLSRAPVYTSGDNQSSQSSGSARPSASRDNQAFQYSGCAVVQPAQDQMLMNPEMATITVQPQPGLRNGDRIVLSLDGQSIDLGNSGQQQYNVSPISRGTHTVTASIVGPDGSNLCQSLALRFHVQQPRLQRPIPTPH
jgi:uncharacterized protein DUF4124